MRKGNEEMVASLERDKAQVSSGIEEISARIANGLPSPEGKSGDELAAIMNEHRVFNNQLGGMKDLEAVLAKRIEDLRNEPDV
ncbi:hypothetical protein ACYULU_07975 [Breznakiellaceae bacterium SP9]